MKYRHTASFGKRQEFVLMSELLKRGFDVYMTLVDDQGIDCIIRLDDCRYIDVQIKARSETAKHGCTFAAMSVKPRRNYFFLFYTEMNNSIWIMPSEDVAQIVYTNKDGKNKGKSTIVFPKTDKSANWKRFEKYRGDNGFRLLTEYGQDILSTSGF